MTDKVLQELAAQFGSPGYVFDIDALHCRMGNIADILGDKIGLCFSIKANPFLTQAMAECAQYLEVCSPGELNICEKLKVDMKRVIFSGVTKTREDVEAAAKNGVGIYTAESELHLKLICDEALRRGTVLPVLLRLTSGNQFGMDEAVLEGIIANREEYKGVCIEGIHFFSGTQKRKADMVLGELERLKQLIANLKTKYGFITQRVEYGPGLAVPYFEKDDFSDTLAMIKTLAPSLRVLANETKLNVEMGRFFTAECGYYLTSVADIKENCGTAYCIVDGGMHHVNYYGQAMGMKQPIIRHFSADGKVKQAMGTDRRWALCGSLCTVADVLVRDIHLSEPCVGDLLVFCNIGAYSVTEGSYLFLSRKMPRILLYSEKNGAVLARDFFCTDILNTNGGLNYYGEIN